MPIVPKSDEPTVQQRGIPDVRQTVRATESALGGAVGQALTGVGDIMAQRAFKLQEEENQTAALEGYNTFNRELIDMQYNNDDAFHRREGREAYDSVKSQTKLLDELQKKHATGLKSQRSRDLFNEQSTRLIDNELKNMSRAGLEGLKTWQKQQISSSIALSMESAAAQFNNLEAIDTEIGNIIDLTQQQADLEGWDDKTTENMLAKQISSMHSGVILTRLNSDPEGAQVYFENEEVRLTEEDRRELEKAIKPKVTLAKSQAVADQAERKFDTMTEATTWIRKNYDGDVEKQALSDIKIRFNEIDAEKSRQDREAVRSATAKINGGEGMESLTNDELRVLQEKDMVETMRKRTEEISTGKPFNSDPATKHQLYLMQRSNPAAFAEVDLYGKDYAGKLSEKDQQTFWSLQNTIDRAAVTATKADEKAKASANKLSRAVNITKPMLRHAGLNPNAKGGPAAERFGIFTNVLLEQLDQLDEPATEKQLQEMVAGLLLQGEYTGSGYVEDDDAIYFEAIQKGAQFDIDDFAKENSTTINLLSERSGVSSENTKILIQALIRRGKPVNVRNLKAAYDSAVRSQ